MFHDPILKKQFFVLAAITFFGLIVAVAFLSLPSVREYPSVARHGIVEKLQKQMTERKLLKSGLVRFTSEDEFKEYITRSREMASFGDLGGGMGGEMMGMEEQVIPNSPTDMGAPIPTPTTLRSAAPDRISGTNVQVMGIDEPDIVKTDGKNIYFASQAHFRPMPMRDEMMIAPGGPVPSGMPPYPWRDTPAMRIIQAFPPEALKEIGEIQETGNLLIDGTTLIVVGNDRLKGYDVSDPSHPKELWTKKLAANHHIQDARLRNGTLYAVSRTSINYSDPCPIRPFADSNVLVIPCANVYHPVMDVPADTMYTVLAINTKDGKVTRLLSFIGSSGSSVLYMSPAALYIAYPFTPDVFAIYAGFFDEAGKDLLPVAIRERLQRLANYDISQQSKLIEFGVLLNQYQQTLDAGGRLRFENEMTNRMSDYLKKHARELERTSITKIARRTLTVEAGGVVPGHLLNQFSLDEFEGNLRVAITIGDRGNVFWQLGIDGTIESANDVYVLDRDLDIIGAVRDLGLTERIYSARFVGDRGYLVTFRQTDPFYVLDLSRPQKPRLAGELKIPGFSSYLHPIGDDMIVGVGREGSQVKIALFDVEDPSAPKEKDKYILKEYWSEIQNTHHAFLMDAKHEIFFLPGSQGGYVFSYHNAELALRAAAADVRARRALFLDDYLYIVGDNRVVVLDEKNWKEVNALDLE
ncbi:MAG: beta-propeller domain-containing protein [Patescibacteria group bacterium]